MPSKMQEQESLEWSLIQRWEFAERFLAPGKPGLGMTAKEGNDLAVSHLQEAHRFGNAS